MLVDRAGESLAREALSALREKSAATHRQFLGLKRFFEPRTVFMHVDAGDCVLALQAALYVERVYAIDPEERVLQRRRLPINLRAVFSGPGGFGLQAGSVHVAFSETLADGRLREVARCLAAGGVYLFRPLRTGLGSKSGARELRAQLLDAGFHSVRFPAFFSVFPRKELVAAIR